MNKEEKLKDELWSIIVGGWDGKEPNDLVESLVDFIKKEFPGKCPNSNYCHSL